MYKGINWQIGDGRSINIWQHRWLKHTWSKTPITPCTEFNSYLTVADLIDSEVGIWNISKISNNFYEVDQIEILQLPLNHLHISDKEIWCNHPEDKFTIKHAYKLYISMKDEGATTSDMQDITSSFFNRMWDIKIPSKVKHFLWRAVHNMLPTVDNLVKRKVNLEQGYKFCNNQREDIMHVFNDCAFSQEICRILTTGWVVAELDGFVGPFGDWALS
ncbi:hypothetical protein LIER_35498 [Lithospermum erythrorhizon]|uniref:Reverse transcriptase zinc-binding domain-containing protein n=1 Tax=Lithospermum erythrorhizon TaxID=34254 RepID=A0AAV3NRM8_LITER